MELIFLGTGTSQGIPIIGCDCEVCKSTNPQDSRLRSSLFFSLNGVDFVIDAGPDFRQQMLTNTIQNIDAILLTHEHKDHVAGLDDIRPFNFIKERAIDIFAELRVIEAVKREFSYVFSQEKYPGIPEMNMREISNAPFKYRGITITPIRVMHWNLPIFGFRIGNFAYISDASYIAPEEQEKLLNLKVLVINALRMEVHYSHFNLEKALDVIHTVKPQQAYITHIGHHLGFHTQVQRMLPPNVFLGYDGLHVEL